MKIYNHFWLVTVKYDPGTPKQYSVVGAKTYHDAQDAVLHAIGYNPGVPISCRAVEGEPPADAIQSYPLTQREKEAIRYND